MVAAEVSNVYCRVWYDCRESSWGPALTGRLIDICYVKVPNSHYVIEGVRGYLHAVHQVCAGICCSTMFGVEVVAKQVVAGDVEVIFLIYRDMGFLQADDVYILSVAYV